MKRANTHLVIPAALASLASTGGCLVFDDGSDNGENGANGVNGGGGDCVEGAIPSSIEEDTVVEAGCYYVDDMVAVDAGTLELEPGTTLVFGEDRGINVHRDGDGRFKAEGTAEEPIILTGEEEVDGFWRGVRYRDSVSADNVLDNVVIEYAGSNDWRFADVTTGILSDRSRVELRDVTIVNSGDYGLKVRDVDDELTMEGGVFSENGAPIRVASPTTVADLDPEADFTGNADDHIYVESGDIEEDTVWVNFDVPLLARNVTNTDHTFEVETGATVLFRQGGGINTEDDGRFRAVGVEDDPVVFAGEESVEGYWDGVRYRESVSADNVLEYVEIHDGGGSDWQFTDGAANLTVQRGARLEVANATLTNSGDHGVLLQTDELDLDFDCDTIDNDDGYGTEDGAESPC